MIGYPVAVGRTVTTSEILKQADETDIKGKAVHVLHTWQDALWEMGVSKKLDLPHPRPIVSTLPKESTDDDQQEDNATSEGGQVTEMPRNELSGNEKDESSLQDTDQNQASGPSLGSEGQYQ
jgi:translation initiation factor 2D